MQSNPNVGRGWVPKATMRVYVRFLASHGYARLAKSVDALRSILATSFEEGDDHERRRALLRAHIGLVAGARSLRRAAWLWQSCVYTGCRRVHAWLVVGLWRQHLTASRVIDQNYRILPQAWRAWERASQALQTNLARSWLVGDVVHDYPQSMARHVHEWRRWFRLHAQRCVTEEAWVVAFDDAIIRLANREHRAVTPELAWLPGLDPHVVFAEVLESLTPGTMSFAREDGASSASPAWPCVGGHCLAFLEPVREGSLEPGDALYAMHERVQRICIASLRQYAMGYLRWAQTVLRAAEWRSCMLWRQCVLLTRQQRRLGISMFTLRLRALDAWLALDASERIWEAQLHRVVGASPRGLGRLQVCRDDVACPRLAHASVAGLRAELRLVMRAWQAQLISQRGRAQQRLEGLLTYARALRACLWQHAWWTLVSAGIGVAWLMWAHSSVSWLVSSVGCLVAIGCGALHAKDAWASWQREGQCFDTRYVPAGFACPPVTPLSLRTRDFAGAEPAAACVSSAKPA